MIHLTMAAPLGVDSLFFSFVERLAVMNTHLCVNPPADQLDAEMPGNWIEAMARSSQHHFIIGYRYPPSYWPQLVQQASTVVLLADGDGIARQVERIYREEQEKGEGKEIQQCMQEIRHTVDAMVDVIEWLLREAGPSRLLPPAVAFQTDAGGAFQRLERFYVEAGVPISETCWQSFSVEALPILREIEPASIDVQIAVQKILSIAKMTPERLNGMRALFSQQGRYQGQPP